MLTTLLVPNLVVVDVTSIEGLLSRMKIKLEQSYSLGSVDAILRVPLSSNGEATPGNSQSTRNGMSQEDPQAPSDFCHAAEVKSCTF